jgi:Holliday junction DNA helicase RuvA
MIALLRGTIVEKHPNLAIIDCHGVGYEVTIPVSTFSSLADTGREVSLRIHTHVREDALLLYGFATVEEKALFEKLISVSGIGPKLAITALSGLAAPELISAIREGAIEKLVRVPGVGKKTAERIVVELRDKLDLLGIAPKAVAAAAGTSLSAIEEDVVSALLNFGAQRPAAQAAVEKARKEVSNTDFEPLFRRALQFLR